MDHMSSSCHDGPAAFQDSDGAGRGAAAGPPSESICQMLKLKQVIGAKYEILDPTVAAYLEDILTVCACSDFTVSRVSCGHHSCVSYDV